MAQDKTPVTSATRQLKQAKINFTPHLYAYEDHGGTAVSARELGVDEHLVIKTLVMEDEQQHPLIILMHGDREVSTKELARTLGVKTITPCNPVTALKHTGYQVGGTSPFATRKRIPIYMEASIANLPLVYINGGKRGFLISLATVDMITLLQPSKVKVAIPAG